MAALSTAKVLKYTVLPGILPRLYALFATGFGYIPYLIAVIYQSAGILARAHPYTDPRNIGRFGIRHVIAEASGNIIWDKRHADQIIIFSVVLIGVVLLFLQMLLLIAALFAQNQVFATTPATGPAPGGENNFNLIFGPLVGHSTNARHDLAFILLDRIFGLEGMYGSCISEGGICEDLRGNPMPAYGRYPAPFHLALHTLLRFYSLGIFSIAVFVVIYYIVTITAETAETGTPFGRRFNKAWAPVRLILCFALLVPLNIGAPNAGLNGAQLGVFLAAKLGSNFATNGWNYFNRNLRTNPANTYAGQVSTLIASPNIPRVNDMVQFIFLARVCSAAEQYAYDTPIQGWLVREGQSGSSVTPGANAIGFDTTDYLAARNFSNYGDILIRFGYRDEEKHKSDKGFVLPACGEMRLPLTAVGAGNEPAVAIQTVYYNLLREMWRNPNIITYANCTRARAASTFGQDPTCTEIVTQDFMTTTVEQYQNSLRTSINAIIRDERMNTARWQTNNTVRRGWAGSGIWYNQIATINGDIAAATMSIVEVSRYPLVMEVVAAYHRQHSEQVSPESVFDPDVMYGTPISYPRGQEDREIASILNRAHHLWSSSNSISGVDSTGGSQPLLDFFNMIMGTSGIFSMRANADIHPLAQLSMLGKSMMHASIRNFTMGTALTMAGTMGENIGGSLGKLVGKLAKAFGGFFSTLGISVMAMSFMLYYILPFMPFIYVFFAVSSWVKAIFEAIVAMPLWALAHIRIDGEGMPGPGATQGYFLIFEIFLRPILIVIGLLAAVQIFSALVHMLNEIFDIVVSNVTGFNKRGALEGSIAGLNINMARGPIDEFFFTAIYVILCYMMGVGSFKLIDTVPNDIMRWFGVSVKPFANQSGEAGQLLERGYQAATLATQKVSGGQLAALIAR